jgi:hypothetical protein
MSYSNALLRDCAISSIVVTQCVITQPQNPFSLPNAMTWIVHILCYHISEYQATLSCNTSADQYFTATTGSFRTPPFSEIAQYGPPITKWAALWAGFVQLMLISLNYPTMMGNYSSIQFELDAVQWEGIRKSRIVNHRLAVVGGTNHPKSSNGPGAY